MFRLRWQVVVVEIILVKKNVFGKRTSKKKGKLKFYNPMPFERTKLLHANGRRKPTRLSNVPSCHNREKSFTCAIHGKRYIRSKKKLF